MADLVKCANCEKAFETSDFEQLSWGIMKIEPACSRECRKALDGMYDKPKKIYNCQYCGPYESHYPRCNQCEEFK